MKMIQNLKILKTIQKVRDNKRDIWLKNTRSMSRWGIIKIIRIMANCKIVKSKGANQTKITLINILKK